MKHRYFEVKCRCDNILTPLSINSIKYEDMAVNLVCPVCKKKVSICTSYVCGHDHNAEIAYLDALLDAGIKNIGEPRMTKEELNQEMNRLFPHKFPALEAVRHVLLGNADREGEIREDGDVLMVTQGRKTAD